LEAAPGGIPPKRQTAPALCQVGDKQIEDPEGHYVVRRYVAGKRSWCSVGTDARTALAKQREIVEQLYTRNAAEVSDDAVVEGAKSIDLWKKMDLYVARQVTRKKTRHSIRAKREIAEFLALTGVWFDNQLTEAAILGWYDKLREAGNSDRTIYNKHCLVFGYLKRCEVDTKSLAPDGPSDFVVRKPTIYTPEDESELAEASVLTWHSYTPEQTHRS